MGSQKFNRNSRMPGADTQYYRSRHLSVSRLSALSRRPCHRSNAQGVESRRDPNGHTICLVGTQIDLPAGLQSFSAHFSPELPQIDEIQFIVRRVEAYVARNSGQKVRTNQEFLGLLVSHLRGLTAADVQRLAPAVFNDGVIDQSDIAKSRQNGSYLKQPLRFDLTLMASSCRTRRLVKLKHWLELRRWSFLVRKLV